MSLSELYEEKFGETAYQPGGVPRRNYVRWLEELVNIHGSQCRRCQLLNELYEQVEETNRNYWVYTELFVMLHGTDRCNNE